MSWSETWYTDDVQTHAETTDNKLNNPENGTQNMVHSTTDFLAKFDWEENNSSLVSDCIKEIQADTQLKTWFENLLKSGIPDDFIDKIKQELEENRKAGLDEETLKFLLTSLIAETIEWWFKIGSSTYVETLNQINQEEDEAVRQEDEAVRQEDKAVQYEWNNIDTKNDNEAQYWREEALRQRLSLNEKYPNLWEQTNENSEKYSVVKNQLENNWVLSQLKELGHDDNFINDYILVQTTLQELKSNPTNYEHDDISTFDKIVKSLDNACNIADTNLNSFSSENISQTRTELFNKDVWNKSLIEARDNNKGHHDYSEMFPEMWEDELIVTYWKFLEWDSKKFWLQYQNDPEMKNKINSIQTNSNPTDEENQLLQNYTTMVENLRKIKDERENNAKDFMEEMCLISQIKWISMCIWQEEWKAFNLNKANEIQNDNWVLTLQWHIDWADLSVRQDTNDPEAHLQTYSKLAIVWGDKNTFKIGWDDNYVDSPFILPSQKEIFTEITWVVKSDFDNLKSADNLSNYFETLQSKIMWRMDNVYEDASLAHHYITNKVKWEKIVDKSKLLIEKIKPDIDFSKSINQANNPDLYPFLKILKFNIDNSTTEEKNKLEKCIWKIWEISNSYRENQGQEKFGSVKYPQIVDNYFKNETWLKDWNENSKIKLISDFFGYYSQNSIDMRANIEWSEWMPSKMVINDIYRDLFESNNWNNKSQTAVKREREQKLNSYRKEEEDQSKKADQWLRLDDDNIWKR